MLTNEHLLEIRNYALELGWITEANGDALIFENENAIVELTAEFEADEESNIHLLFRINIELPGYTNLMVEHYSLENLKSILEKYKKQVSMV